MGKVCYWNSDWLIILEAGAGFKLIFFSSVPQVYGDKVRAGKGKGWTYLPLFFTLKICFLSSLYLMRTFSAGSEKKNLFLWILNFYRKLCTSPYFTEFSYGVYIISMFFSLKKNFSLFELNHYKKILKKIISYHLFNFINVSFSLLLINY